jgi:O-antigen ligase
LKCKYGVNVDIIRFWKELILIFLVVFLFFVEYRKHNYSLKKLYHKNTLLGLTTAFILCSAVYIYFPFFEIKVASVLGFRYDTFFLIAMIVGLYAGMLWELRYFLKMLFLSTFGILIVFLPWYIFGDIASKAAIFWYSSEVSTYVANQCISFSQNVDGHHRFQATFWGPIRMSVFLTIVWSLFAGWVLSSERFTRRQQYWLIAGFGFLISTWIFYSYSKTSMLWAMFAIATFIFLGYKYIHQKKITRKFYAALTGLTITPIILVALLKWELFLHLGAVLNRLENLSKSLEMFFYNPIWYGLWIAGPASQIWNSIESAGNWQIAAASVLSVHKFLPENWYVQILLEQWILGFTLFMSLIILIWYRLWHLVKTKKDYLSVGIATAYFSLCFMALFTHAFEEAATSYILFLFIWIVLTKSMYKERAWKK